MPGAVRSDGGGSVRVPAACCGGVGLKATRGRVRPGPYGVDVAGLGVEGALTRDVRDTAIRLDVLSPPWHGDLDESREDDVDRINQRFYEAARDKSTPDVLRESWSAAVTQLFPSK